MAWMLGGDDSQFRRKACLPDDHLASLRLANWRFNLLLSPLEPEDTPKVARDAGLQFGGLRRH